MGSGGSGDGRGSDAFGSAFSALRVPSFRWLFAGNSAFFLAMASQGLVRPYLAYQLTDSPFALGLVMASMAMPMLLLSPVGGAMADRFERRNLIFLAQLAAMSGEVMVLALLLLGRLEYWHLLVGTVALGCSFPISGPARQAIVVNLVGKRGLSSGMALTMGMQNVTRVVGPALAGFLIPILDIDGVYCVSVGLYLVALVTILVVPRFHPPDHARAEPMLASLIGGFRYVRSHPLVLLLLFYGLVPMFLAMPFQNLLVVFTEDVWHTGARGLGFVNASIGVGGVVGSMLVAARPAGAARGRVMLVSALLFGGLLAAAAASTWFALSVGLVSVGFAFANVFGTLNNTAIQLLIPDDVRGRVSSFLMMSFSVPMLGALPVSAAAEAVGAPLAVSVSSALAVVSALAFHFGSRRLRELDAEVTLALRAEG